MQSGPLLQQEERDLVKFAGGGGGGGAPMRTVTYVASSPGPVSNIQSSRRMVATLIILGQLRETKGFGSHRYYAGLFFIFPLSPRPRDIIERRTKAHVTAASLSPSFPLCPCPSRLRRICCCGLVKVFAEMAILALFVHTIEFPLNKEAMEPTAFLQIKSPLASLNSSPYFSSGQYSSSSHFSSRLSFLHLLFLLKKKTGLRPDLQSRSFRSPISLITERTTVISKPAISRG